MSDETEEIIQQNTEIPAEFSDEVVDDTEVLEFEYNADGEEDLKKTLKKFRADLKVAKAEKLDYLTGWQRAQADYMNFKKGQDERLSRARSLGKESILEDIIPTLDGFDMAMSNKEAWEKVDANWRTGIEYLISQLLTTLRNNGVTVIDQTNVPFDPNLYEAIENITTDNQSKDHMIASIIQKGYKVGDRIIRPARVNVWTLQ